MAKRFIDTEVWKKAWFRELSPKMKAVWLYLITNCDHAGIYEVDLGLMSFMVGTEVTHEEIEEHLGNQVQIVNSGSKWFLTKFIKFQYGQLGNSKVHLSVMEKLDKYNITLNEPLTNPLITHKDKDIDKDKDKDKVKDIVAGNLLPESEVAHLVKDFYAFQKSSFPNKYKQTPNFIRSCEVVDKLIRLDGYTMDEIKNALEWSVKDDFWSDKILSLIGLRKQSSNGMSKFANMFNAFQSKDKATNVRDFING